MLKFNVEVLKACENEPYSINREKRGKRRNDVRIFLLKMKDPIRQSCVLHIQLQVSQICIS